MAKLVINDAKKQGYIAPEIYEQFSEHLGRGIYEGLFIREDYGIPSINGMSTDVVEEIKEIEVTVLR